jgi:ABC-type lipoprotein release transport system permease subunit
VPSAPGEDRRTEPSETHLLVVYAVALLTTLAPAVRASRVYPAEALRYQ